MLTSLFLIGYKQGAESVRGIFLDMSELKKKLPLEKCTFSGMRNLRYLKFYNSCCHRECEADCKLSFPEGLEFPLDEVRYLYWLKFPLKKLPKDFNPKNLTDLSLPYSEIEEIWEGVKVCLCLNLFHPSCFISSPTDHSIYFFQNRVSRNWILLHYFIFK